MKTPSPTLQRVKEFTHLSLLQAHLILDYHDKLSSLDASIRVVRQLANVARNKNISNQELACIAYWRTNLENCRKRLISEQLIKIKSCF